MCLHSVGTALSNLCKYHRMTEGSILNYLLFYPIRQKIALLRSAKLISVLLKFIVSENDSFRFSLSFSASFWMVFVDPGAAPPVHEKHI